MTAQRNRRAVGQRKRFLADGDDIVAVYQIFAVRTNKSVRGIDFFIIRQTSRTAVHLVAPKGDFMSITGKIADGVQFNGF